MCLNTAAAFAKESELEMFLVLLSCAQIVMKEKAKQRLL